MTSDENVVTGVGLALTEFLQGEENDEHPYAYVLVLTEHNHAGDGDDLTPVNVTAHNIELEDAVMLLRHVADQIERRLQTEH